MSNGSSKISFSSIHMGEAKSVKRPQVQIVLTDEMQKPQADALSGENFAAGEEAEASLLEPVAPAYAAAGLFAAPPRSGQNIFQRNAMLFAALTIVVLTVLLGIATSLLLSNDKRQTMTSEPATTRNYAVEQGNGHANKVPQLYETPDAFERSLEGNIGTLQSPDKIRVGQRLIIPS